MSIWKEIKYALNSTLGMPNSKPLDEIIDESVGGGKTIQCGNDLSVEPILYTLIEGTYTVTSDVERLPKQIKMNVNGTVGFKAKDLYNTTFRIYKNEQPLEQQIVYFQIPFKKGDVFAFEVEKTAYTGSIRDLCVYGKIVSHSGAKIEDYNGEG